MEVKEKENNQEQNTEVKTEQDGVIPKKQFDGVLQDLREERRLRQYFANQVEESKRKVEEIQAQLKQIQEEKQNKVFDEIVPGEKDEPVTKEGLIKAYKALQEAEKQKKDAEERQKRAMNFNESINKVTAKYADRAKYGLDFDSLRPIIDRELARKVAENPYYKEALLYEKNPAEILYKMALEAPDVREKVKLIDNDELLSKVEGRKVDKTNLTGTQITPPKELTEAEIVNMSHEERIKRRKEIGEFMKKRAKK